jgi:hypothetical protein
MKTHNTWTEVCPEEAAAKYSLMQCESCGIQFTSGCRPRVVTSIGAAWCAECWPDNCGCDCCPPSLISMAVARGILKH